MAQDISKPDAARSAVTRYRDPLAAMRDEMDRVLDSFLGGGFFARSLPTAAAGGPATCNVDIRENDNEILIEAELPGVSEGDVEVTVRDGVLLLRGEKKSQRDEKKDTSHLVERSYGRFERSFTLPERADADRISARFDNGVLHITVPKRAEAERAERRIEIAKG